VPYHHHHHHIIIIIIIIIIIMSFPVLGLLILGMDLQIRILLSLERFSQTFLIF
jgi:hypothetical protein